LVIAFARAFTMVRLLFGSACFCIALLAIVPAPNGTLWMLAIGVTEWGHWLAAVALLTLLPGWSATRAGSAGAMLGVLAALLALYPITRATLLARRLPGDLQRTFGNTPARSNSGAPPRSAPLSGLDLIRGVGSPEVAVQSVVYVSRGAKDLRLDVYQPPPAGPPAPCVVVIHGGSWQRYDSTQLAKLNYYLAARGYIVASINYRLSPEFKFPAARDDLRSAIAFLKENHERFRLDPERLVLLGRSAGGQLALLVAYGDKDPAVRGVVGFYGMTDLGYIYSHPANPRVIDSRDILRAHLGGSPEEVPALYEEASPTSHVSRDVPPTLLIHGGRDELFPWALSELLDSRLSEAGASHYFLRLPWATHGCDFNFSGPSGQISTYAIERFIASVTK
ncbi:MAG: alpha/beta hydrolase, partial [Acidobacteriota bacterium]